MTEERNEKGTRRTKGKRKDGEERKTRQKRRKVRNAEDGKKSERTELRRVQQEGFLKKAEFAVGLAPQGP